MKPDLEKIYLSCPVFLQNVFCSLEGWRINRKRYDKVFYKHLQEYEEHRFWDYELLEKYRNQRLAEFIKYCENYIPYYKKRFNKLGISSANIHNYEDLKYIPVLNKNTVRENYNEFSSGMIPKKELSIAHTSGSTGSGLRFAVTSNAMSEQWAVWWRYRRWHGIPFNTWCAYFGGRSVVPVIQNNPPFWRVNYPGKQVFFSGYHIKPENIKHYLRKLKQLKPEWIHGYPSLISLIASYILENGTSLNFIPKWITTGAENLLPQQRKVIKEAFGIEPHQHYGLAEGAANMSECEYDNLHVDEDFSAVEFIPGDEGVYRIIGTNFTNYATPLLRYDTGDIAQLESPSFKCPCGRLGRIVKAVDGRLEDYVLLKNGTKIGRMDHIFKDTVNIREAQICQSIPGEITVHIVAGHDYSLTDEKEIIKQFEKRVGKDTKITIKYMKELQRPGHGKLRFVISKTPADAYSKQTCCN